MARSYSGFGWLVTPLPIFLEALWVGGRHGYPAGTLRLGNPEPNIYLGGVILFQEGLAGRGQSKFIHKERWCEGAQDILKRKLPTELKLNVHVLLYCEPSLIHSK